MNKPPHPAPNTTVNRTRPATIMLGNAACGVAATAAATKGAEDDAARPVPTQERTHPPGVGQESIVPDAIGATSARASHKPSGRRRRLAPGDIAAFQRELWHAIRRASQLLDDEDVNPDTIIKVLNALSTAGNTFNRIVEATSFQGQLDELKAEIDRVQQTTGRGWRA